MTSRIKQVLPEVGCPNCGDILKPGPGVAIASTSWRDCLRRCLECELGFSNAYTNPTTLFSDPRMNIPPKVRGGVIETLDLTLNERNRANKKVKFGFSTSEDALTWTIFKYLHESGQLVGVLRRAGLPIPDRASRPLAVLLWGVPIPLDRENNEEGWALRARLEGISDRLGENPRSRTEPDVVIDLGPDGIVIIEVKHRSGTDVKTEGYAGWDRYYSSASPLLYAAAVRASRCYELARNWRFGLELASDPLRPFTLAYLGPESLFRGRDALALQSFESCLPIDGTARFQKFGCNRLLGEIRQPPDWLVRYVTARGYTITTEGR